MNNSGCTSFDLGVCCVCPCAFASSFSCGSHASDPIWMRHQCVLTALASSRNDDPGQSRTSQAPNDRNYFRLSSCTLSTLTGLHDVQYGAPVGIQVYRMISSLSFRTVSELDACTWKACTPPPLPLRFSHDPGVLSKLEGTLAAYLLRAQKRDLSFGGLVRLAPM